MSKNKKRPAPDAANIENGQRLEKAGAVSKNNSTMKKVAPSIVSSYLGTGEANAVSMDKLSEMLGKTPRVTRLTIARERKRGVLIMSSNAGYFLPDLETEKGREDALHYLRTMKARARHSWACAYVAERAIEKINGSGV